jgi:hypothetical protein
MIQQTPLITGVDGIGGTSPADQASQVQKLPENFPKFPEYINKLFNQIRSDGANERIQRIRKWVTNDKFYQGQQLGYISPISGRWVDIDPHVTDDDDDEPLFVNNQFRYHIKALRKEGTRSQTRLHVRATSDRTEKIGAAELANALIEAYQRKTWDEHSRQTELMNMLLYGNYFRYTYYTNDISGGSARVAITQDVNIKPAPDALYCMDCDTSSPMDQSAPDAVPICPECGSDRVDVTPVPEFTTPVPTGEYEEVPVGDCFTEVVNPMEVNVHLHSRKIETSPYLYREREIMRCTLKAKFPNAALKSPKQSNENSASTYIKSLESASGNVGGYSSSSQRSDGGGPFDMLLFEQLWLEPSVYHDYVTPVEFKTSTGEVIPQGTAAIEVCPDGMYIARVGDEILDIRNENKADHWTHGTFDLIPSRFFGDGLEDMVELQRQLNEVISLRFENMMANAAPNTIFNPLKIDASQFSGKPREMSPLQNATPDDDIRKFVMRLEGTGLDRENFAAEENYKKDLQTLSGAFSIMSGMPDVDIKTATGMQIVRDAAVSALGPALAIRAGVDVEWAYQILKLVQTYWTSQRFVPFQGRYGAATGGWFASADVLGDFEITAENGSWMPRTDMEVRADLASYICLESTGLPLGFLNPNVPEAVQKFAAETFRIPISLDKNRVHARIAHVRIEKLLEMEKLLVQNGLLDPTMQPPVGADPTLPLQQQAMAQDQIAHQRNLQMASASAPQNGPPSGGGNGPSTGASGEDGTPTQSPDEQPNPQEQEEPKTEEQKAYEQQANTAEAQAGAQAADAQLLPEPVLDPFTQLAMLLAQEVPVKVLVDEHKVFINTYRDWLSTDDGQAASPMVQYVLEMKVAEHFLAGGQVQTYLAALTPAGAGGDMSAGGPPPSGGGAGPVVPTKQKTSYPEGQGPQRPTVNRKGAQHPSPKQV